MSTPAEHPESPHDRQSKSDGESERRRLPRWLPWVAALCAAGIVVATFRATQPSRTPAQQRVESVAVRAFVAPDADDADAAAYAGGLTASVRDYLARTPGLAVPEAAAGAERVVEGTVMRRGEYWYVSLRITDDAGREVRSRTREWPVADGDALPFALARDVTSALKLPPPKVDVVVR